MAPAAPWGVVQEVCVHLCCMGHQCAIGGVSLSVCGDKSIAAQLLAGLHDPAGT